MPSGVYDLEELQKWGKERGWCPYYLTRQAINHANILVFNYQYMLDPKVGRCQLHGMTSLSTNSMNALTFRSISFRYSQDGIQRTRVRKYRCL